VQGYKIYRQQRYILGGRNPPFKFKGGGTIKILHIISGDDSGGAKTHLLTLCRNSGNLFENVVGCINEGALFQEAQSMGLEALVFEQKSRCDMRIVKEIKQYVLSHNIDIVNFHGARANFLYMFVEDSTGFHAVTTMHSDYRYDFINNKIKYALFTPLNILALKRFRNFICVSDRIKNLLEEKNFKGNKYVVRNGIDVNMHINVSREELRRKCDIPEDAFVYTMVARMHPVKNHIGLIEAGAILARELDDFRILLVGSGDYKRKVEEKVSSLNMEKFFIFAGHQNNPLDYINAGDVNILTSFNETFPIVILEGALVKKAAICSNVGDIGQLLSEKTGFVVNPDSPEDIYAGMKEAYKKRNKLKEMGEQLYHEVVENYGVDKFCERYYNAYKSILTGDRND